MTRGRGTGRTPVAIAGVAFSLLVLSGCGAGQTPGNDASAPTSAPTTSSAPTVAPEATRQTIVLASPAASPPPAAGTPSSGNRAIAVETLTAKIENGALSPKDISGATGASYILDVTGDGQEHRLAITGLLNEQPVAASGVTSLQFTVSEAPGDFPITLDGKDAGVFHATSATGLPVSQ